MGAQSRRLRKNLVSAVSYLRIFVSKQRSCLLLASLRSVSTFERGHRDFAVDVG